MGKLVNDKVWVDEITIEFIDDPETMEQINKITGMDAFHEVNFTNKLDYNNYNGLTQYTTKAKLDALMEGKIDFIVFRLDV